MSFHIKLTDSEKSVSVDGKLLDGVERIELAADHQSTKALFYVRPETVEVTGDQYHIATTCPCCGNAVLHHCTIPSIEGSDDAKSE